MNDNDVIKALECCAYHSADCEDCCFKHLDAPSCGVEMDKNALDLIKRLQVENERLKKENAILSTNADNAFQEGLNENRELFKNEVYAEIKSEARKEFAERLCDGRVSNDPVVIAVKVELEMMDGKDGANKKDNES